MRQLLFNRLEKVARGRFVELQVTAAGHAEGVRAGDNPTGIQELQVRADEVLDRQQATAPPPGQRGEWLQRLGNFDDRIVRWRAGPIA